MNRRLVRGHATISDMNQTNLLTSINLDDLVTSIGWQASPFAASLLRRLFSKPAHNFAQLMVEFDRMVGEQGLVSASRITQRNFAVDVRVHGADLIPDSAFLALSNHPGMSDTLSLFCTLNRPDLKIIALDRPFLNALPNTSRQLFYVKEDAASRMSLVRQVTAHLKAGGAALTFPAGHIEPDPDIHDGAVESLQAWTDSAGVFIRMAPDVPIVPVLVRGVVSRRYARHLLLNIKHAREEKEKLAAALQLLSHVAFHQTDASPRVQIGQAVHTRQLGTTDPKVIHQAVVTEMTRLIQNPPQDEGQSVM